MNKKPSPNLRFETLKKERPFFENSFVENNGSLEMLVWDGSTYQPDPNFLDLNLAESLKVNACKATDCLNMWVDCVLLKSPPENCYIVSLQPTQEMIDVAKKEFAELNLSEEQKANLDDAIVFSHQALISEFTKRKAP